MSAAEEVRLSLVFKGTRCAIRIDGHATNRIDTRSTRTAMCCFVEPAIFLRNRFHYFSPQTPLLADQFSISSVFALVEPAACWIFMFDVCSLNQSTNVAIKFAGLFPVFECRAELFSMAAHFLQPFIQFTKTASDNFANLMTRTLARFFVRDDSLYFIK